MTLKVIETFNDARISMTPGHRDTRIQPMVKVDGDRDLYVQGKSILLSCPNTHYGHNLMDESSRLWSLLDKNFLSDVDNIVIFSAQVTSNSNRIIEANNWHQDPVSDLTGILWFLSLLVAFEEAYSKKLVLVYNTNVVFSTLFVPSKLMWAGCGHGAVNLDLQEVFSKIRNFYNPSGRMFRKILITRSWIDHLCLTALKGQWHRAHDNVRICLNNDELEELFTSFGFEILTFEKMDFKAQIKACSEAQVLAGLGGSGLHNSCYVFANCHVISLGDNRWFNSAFEMNGNQDYCNMMSPNLVYHFIKMVLKNREACTYSLDIPYYKSRISNILSNNLVLK